MDSGSSKTTDERTRFSIASEETNPSKEVKATNGTTTAIASPEGKLLKSRGKYKPVSSPPYFTKSVDRKKIEESFKAENLIDEILQSIKLLHLSLNKLSILSGVSRSAIRRMLTRKSDISFKRGFRILMTLSVLLSMEGIPSPFQIEFTKGKKHPHSKSSI